MQRSGYLLEKARQCRCLARDSKDTRAIAILISTAESYEAQAAAEAKADATAQLGLSLK